MNRQQKKVIANFLVIVFITIIGVVAIANLKDYVNKSESTKAMNHLAKIIADYRQAKGIIPPQSFIDSVDETLCGSARIGEICYRARWIEFDAEPNEPLAYVEKNFRHSFLETGFIVLTLDGKVKWLDVVSFQKLIQKYQKPYENTVIFLDDQK